MTFVSAVLWSTLDYLKGAGYKASPYVLNGWARDPGDKAITAIIVDDICHITLVSDLSGFLVSQDGPPYDIDTQVVYLHDANMLEILEQRLQCFGVTKREKNG